MPASKISHASDLSFIPGWRDLLDHRGDHGFDHISSWHFNPWPDHQCDCSTKRPGRHGRVQLCGLQHLWYHCWVSPPINWETITDQSVFFSFVWTQTTPVCFAGCHSPGSSTTSSMTSSQSRWAATACSAPSSSSSSCFSSSFCPLRLASGKWASFWAFSCSCSTSFSSSSVSC